MTKRNPFIVIKKEATMNFPTYEESREFQAKLLGLWEQQQRVMNYTEASIALGLKCVNEVLDTAGKFVWEITISDVDDFYLKLVGRGLAYSTRRKYQSTLTTFLEYLRSRHATEIWEKYGVKVPIVVDKYNKHYHRNDDSDNQVVPPHPEILKRFWDCMKEEMNHARKYHTLARDYAIFRILELTGLRTKEIIMLDIKDCRFDLGEKGKLHIRYGKGSKGSGYKQRWVPLLDDAEILLKWYLENIRPIYTNSKDGALFISENSTRLNKDSVRGNLRRWQVKFGFGAEEQFSPHQLRHAFATRQTELGVDLLTLKELLGHADVATTLNYANPGQDYIEKRVRMAQAKWKEQLLKFSEEGDE